MDGFLTGIFLVGLTFLPGIAYPYVPCEQGLETENLLRGGRELYMIGRTVAGETVEHMPVTGWLLGGLVILILTVGLYLIVRPTAPNPPSIEVFESLSLVDRHLAGYHGPLLPGEQETLQLMLEDRAFLDNLTLSPLSDLFLGAPW